MPETAHLRNALAPLCAAVALLASACVEETLRTPEPVLHSITGELSGLEGTLKLAQGVEELTLTANGPFRFEQRVPEQSSYAVRVVEEPAEQRCAIEPAGGVIEKSDVSVKVACSASTLAHPVGGVVVGLATGGAVVLRNNGGDPLGISGITATGEEQPFSFPKALAKGASYTVTAEASAPYTCAVENGSGTMGGAAISDVRIVCSLKAYTVAGDLVNIKSGTQIVLANNGADQLTISASSSSAQSFRFATALPNGAAYAVTVEQQPAGQRCLVANGHGTISGRNVINVNVTCAEVLTVGGTLAGLSSGESIALALGGTHTEALTLSENGAFTFAQGFVQFESYAVTVATHPASSYCVVRNGTGVVPDSPVTSVSVNCVPSTSSFAIEATVEGLMQGEQLTLGLEGGASTAITADGAVTLPGVVGAGLPYAVAMIQPERQSCELSPKAGIMGDGPVALQVLCSPDIVVLRVGEVDGTLSEAAAPVSLFQYKHGGEQVREFKLPSKGPAGSPRVTLTGRYSATTVATYNDGMPNRSVDERQITFLGYAADVGTATVATTAGIDRLVLGMNFQGGVVVRALESTAFDMSRSTSAITVDGSGYWASGQSGLYYLPPLAEPPAAAVQVQSGNYAGLGFSKGRLQAIAQILSAGTAVTFADAQPKAASELTTLGNVSSGGVGRVGGQKYVTLDSDGDGADDVAYLAVNASESYAGTAILNVRKWYFTAGAWSSLSTFAPKYSAPSQNAVADIVALKAIHGVRIVAVTSGGANLVTFVDDGTTNEPAVTILATAPAGTAFRGVTLAPKRIEMLPAFAHVNGLVAEESVELMLDGVVQQQEGAGSVSFSNQVAKEGAYSLAIATQPDYQRCSVTSAVKTATELTAQVECLPNPPIEVEVAGLDLGKTLKLSIDGQTLVLYGTGAAIVTAFPKPARSDSTSSAAITQQPADQSCVASTATTTHVSVTCAASPFVSISATALPAGKSVLLALTSAGRTSELRLESAAVTPFASSVQKGSTYTVSVLQQPMDATCYFGAGNDTSTSGTADANVDLSITCEANLFYEAEVVALLESSYVRLGLEDETLTIDAVGSKPFVHSVPPRDSAIAVAVREVSASQTCYVDPPTTVDATHRRVLVTCFPGLVVTASVSGLPAGKQVGLALQASSGGTSISSSATAGQNGNTIFPKKIPTGATYTVSVAAQPVDATCKVTSNGTGSAISADVTVGIECSLNVWITVNVAGLEPLSSIGPGGLFAKLTGPATERLALVKDGATRFSSFPRDSAYSVALDGVPDMRTCVMTGATAGTASDDRSVTVTCSTETEPPIKAKVRGLHGNVSLVLRAKLGGNDKPTVSAAFSGTYIVGRAPAGTAYELSIVNQPAVHYCTIDAATPAIGTTTSTTVIGISCVRNIMLLTVMGDATEGLTGKTSSIVIEEYSLNPAITTPVRTITAQSTSIVVPGSSKQASSAQEGMLTLSGDEKHVTFVGYNAAPGIDLINTDATIHRLVGEVTTASNNYSIVARVSDVFVGSSAKITRITSALTNDGTGYWISGDSPAVPPSPGGIIYTPRNTSATPETFARIMQGTSPYAKAMAIAGGQLFFVGSSSGNLSLHRFGDLRTTTTGQQESPYGANSDSNTPAIGAFTSFSMVNLSGNADPEFDHLYFGNASTVGSTPYANMVRNVFNNQFTNPPRWDGQSYLDFSPDLSAAPGNGRVQSMISAVLGSTIRVYAVSTEGDMRNTTTGKNVLYYFDDTVAQNTAAKPGPVATVLKTAADKQAFRGLCFAPVP